MLTTTKGKEWREGPTNQNKAKRRREQCKYFRKRALRGIDSCAGGDVHRRLDLVL